MKKRFLALGTALAVSAIMMVGCGATEKADDTAADTTQNTEAEETGAAEEADNTVEESTDFSGMISPVSREDGSGTRGAFIELFGIETKDADGNKIDNTTDDDSDALRKF